MSKENNIFKKPKHATSIGGQALIGGLMMIGPKDSAIAIRKPDGEIIINKKPLPKRNKFFKLPLIRGSVGLFRQMVLGISALMYSAEFVDIEDEDSQNPTNKKPLKFDNFINKLFSDKGKDILIYISLIISLAFSIGLFILLPNFLASLLKFDKNTSSGLIMYNLVEGVVRVVLFFGYIVLVSKMKDVKKVWQYHGAEHKTIHCYENEEELTIENVKKHPTKHPRCGTSFLFTVMIISIIVFSFTGWHNVLINILIRLLLIPLVAGLSYEIIKFAGRSNSTVMRAVSIPGLMFQTFTTEEPDDDQIEVAIAAIKEVIVDKKDDDKW